MFWKRPNYLMKRKIAEKEVETTTFEVFDLRCKLKVEIPYKFHLLVIFEKLESYFCQKLIGECPYFSKLQKSLL
ncbi:hypothetical protein AEA09_11480 [Lysinibacillus contaminans]|uniref:Uncharacterized protein n=1 Tax=Lysinibacillus contaminans TaxID=1293441 RepID=A0ABR5K423_9BACI|nr:hypothetical protein AEA09_11480 [Lysinibacillus contaminans]